MLTLKTKALLVASMAFGCFPPAVRAQSVDLVALSLEVTQGIQDLNNSVRLVAKKRTFVRFYARTSQGTATAGALLTARRGDSSITLSPMNPGAVITVVANPDRTIRDQAFLFELPDGYRQDTVSLRAEVNPSAPTRTVDEPDYTNNAVSTDVKFEEVPPLALVIYSIGYQDKDGNAIINDEKDARMMANWLSRSWPVPNVRYWLRREDISRSMGRGLPECDAVNAFLTAKRLEDLQNPSSAIPANARYYGMVDERGGFMRGCADGLPGYASSGPTGPGGPDTSYEWDTDGSYGDWYGAHEVAHNFMRYHAEFCGAKAGDTYPYDGGRISPSLSGADTVMGFDGGTHAVYGPNWKDNMTYCENQWTGKFSYHGLMDALQQNLLPSAEAAGERLKQASLRQATAQDRLLVVGSVDSTKMPPTVKMPPFYLLKDAVEGQPRQPGNYAIVLKKGDQELANYPFTPTRMSSGPGKDPNAPELSLSAIQELVPYVDGTTVVDILGPAKALLYSVKAGAAFPVVAVQTPKGGETLSGDAVEVSWTASDPDGDPLAFTIQYSADGGQNWETVEENIREQKVLIDRIDLSGSASALFRVLATDGIHTTVATSKSFALARVSPVVAILSPDPDEAYVVGETVTLEAYAYDPDSGTVADENVSWSSSIDGALGTGVEIDVATLSAGTHTITVTVKNNAGAPVTVSSKLLVVARASDLPVVANKLVVEPDTILLDAANGISSQAFEIFNQNARQALSWTASADQPWIKLDVASGTTPAVVTVSLGVVPATTAGTLGGQVTVTTGDGQKVVIRVRVQK